MQAVISLWPIFADHSFLCVLEFLLAGWVAAIPISALNGSSSDSAPSVAEELLSTLDWVRKKPQWVL